MQENMIKTTQELRNPRPMKRTKNVKLLENVDFCSKRQITMLRKPRTRYECRRHVLRVSIVRAGGIRQLD